MCRPGSSFVHQVIAGALLALAVGGCGKGLYTQASQFKDTGSGGGVIDPGTGTGTGGGMSSSTDPFAGDGGSNRNPDGPPRLDAAPRDCETRWAGRGTETNLACADATLTIPKDTVRAGAEVPVTLSLWSKDGILSLPDGNDTWRDYGTSGPIYSIFVEDKYIENPVTLRIKAIPASPIPPGRFRLAYVDTDSRCWITADISSYDTKTNEVVGTVTVNKPGMHYFTPVEACAAGEVCDFNLTCKGEACQK